MPHRCRLIDRRSFVKAAGSLFLAGLAPANAEALERADAVFASAFVDSRGGYGIALLSERGAILHRYSLPGRGHDVVLQPGSDRVVAFARRPGTFAAIVSPSRSDEPVIIRSPEGRHFYGHGVFSTDGRLLYAAENDFGAARGVVGVYDATDGFARIGEFASGGVGPHEIVLLRDGKSMLVANGGIETHPDYGRAKLNLAMMKPNLSLVDLETGEVLGSASLPPELHKLSIRHVAVSRNGEVWFACQDQDKWRDDAPLIGRISENFEITSLSLDFDHQRKLRGYVGSIAVNDEADSIVVTSPIGHTALEIGQRDARVKAVSDIRDVCGVAAWENRFVLSSGEGMFDGHRSPVGWDHHIARRA